MHVSAQQQSSHKAHYVLQSSQLFVMLIKIILALNRFYHALHHANIGKLFQCPVNNIQCIGCSLFKFGLDKHMLCIGGNLMRAYFRVFK